MVVEKVAGGKKNTGNANSAGGEEQVGVQASE